MELTVFMVQEIFFEIASKNVKCVSSNTVWQTWKWKLDPYTIKQPEKPYDLLISLAESVPLDSESQIVPVRVLQEIQAGFFCHRVYSTTTGDTIWQYERIKNGEVVLKYLVSSSWNQITLLEDNSNTNGQLAFEYLTQMIPSVLLPFHVISFHGVLMEYQGMGIIISAPSGTGKTTHARLWRDLYQALIINGDRSHCVKENGVWTGFGLPWSGTSGEQINRSVPVKAMVVLEQSEQNRTEMLTGLESFSAVLPHLLYPGWDAELTGTAMDLIDDFLSEIPVIRLSCRPDEEAVNVLKAALESL